MFFLLLTPLALAHSTEESPVEIRGASSADTPEFRAENPEDAAIARIAWEAAVECTGRPGEAHPVIHIHRRPIAGGFLGYAWWDDAGVYRIDVDPQPGRMEEVIVHEVAHAWVRKGPPTLVEGRTELLADCIVERRTGLAALQWDDGRDLRALPDLMTWSNDQDHGPARLAGTRTDAYLGAARLVRTAAMLVPRQKLWETDQMEFDQFAALLADAPGAERLLAVLSEGAQAQRFALADTDLDGLPNIAEHIHGTRPDAWDTDGNGWWDGAVLGVPSTAVVLPFDGSPVCTGLIAPPGAKTTAAYGGNLRGQGQPRAQVRQTRSGAPLLVELRGTTSDVTGGLWAVIEGPHLQRTELDCLDTHRATVWAASTGYAHLLPEFIRLLLDAEQRAEARWGPVTRRMAVALGASRTRMDDHVVELSVADVQAALEHDTLEPLATLAVSLHRVWDNGTREWPVAAAMARSLTDEQTQASPANGATD